MKVKVHTEFDTELPPEQVIAALTDFSETRPQKWPNLDPKKYRVHEVGDTWAIVTEGSRSPNVWARERYDWSRPGKVSWTAEESNFCAPGSGVQLSVSPRAGGGSHVLVDWERSPTSLTGYLIAALMKVGKRRLLASDLQRALDGLAERAA